MLKMTRVELELMTDVDMNQFVEKGLRGKISYIAKRYGQANNKYIDGSDRKRPSKNLRYLDANNQYGWAMSQYLPTGGFRWVTREFIEYPELFDYGPESSKGLIVEVDLEYPEELHDLHDDYPLAPERIKIQRDMLSEYSRETAKKYKISTGTFHKLVSTLVKKEKYVLHYRNLQYI